MEQVLAIGILLLVQMIMMIVIVVKISKMHGYISEITQRVETYLDVVLQEADGESAGEVTQCNFLTDKMSVQEEQMRQTIERKQKKQQEAIFEAVLQEIFP